MNCELCEKYHAHEKTLVEARATTTGYTYGYDPEAGEFVVEDVPLCDLHAEGLKEATRKALALYDGASVEVQELGEETPHHQEEPPPAVSPEPGSKSADQPANPKVDQVVADLEERRRRMQGTAKFGKSPKLTDVGGERYSHWVLNEAPHPFRKNKLGSGRRNSQSVLAFLEWTAIHEPAEVASYYVPPNKERVAK